MKALKNKVILFITALVLMVAGLVATASSANATSTPPYQPTRTIVVHFGTGLSAGSAWYNAAVSRVNYINSIGGKPVKIVLGSCQSGFGCVNMTADHYGQSWAGVWVQGPSCNYSGTSWSSTDYHFHCAWDSVNQFVGNIYYDTTDTLTQTQREIVVCHEMGHALGLGHSGGTYCMQATVDSTPASTSNTYSPDDQLNLYDIYVNHGIPNCCPQG